MRIATIDIGTNTVLLLVVERAENGELVPLLDRAEITRLGEGVDRARVLAPQAIERTLSCLRGYAAEIARLGVERLDVAGTSAMRDASGAGRAFVERAREILGVAPRVVSGDEEASLAFAGGMFGLGLSGAVTAFDVGGGSTEIISGRVAAGETRVEARCSLDVGSVRLFERHVRADPPSAMELSSIRAFVLDQLLALPPPSLAPVVGMAGTVTTLAAIARGVDPYDPARIHGTRISAREIAETGEKLAALPLEERRKVAGLEPKRADVIPVGAIIVQTILSWARADEVIVSDRGVRWGLARALAAGP